MAGKDPRGKLLDAAIDHIAARGISDLSLRELAAAIGTSHRMLIHHFGSREALWVEVIRAVEARQRALLAEVVPDPDAPARRRRCASGGRTSPTSRCGPNERLFFEVYGQALQGRPGTVELLDGIVDSLDRAGGRRASWPTGCRARRRSPRRGSGWPSAAGCCSTCWPPATARPSTPPMDAYIALVEARLAGYSGHQPPTDVRVGGYDAEGSSSRWSRLRSRPGTRGAEAVLRRARAGP